MLDRTFMETFYAAFYGGLSARDPQRFASFFAADIRLTMYGPMDVLPYVGHSVGKAAALEVFRKVCQVFGDIKYALDYLVIDGDAAAAFVRYSAFQRATGRGISYNVAHFFRFGDREIAEFRVLIDTFDVVEQMLGHQILAQPRAAPEPVSA